MFVPRLPQDWQQRLGYLVPVLPTMVLNPRADISNPHYRLSGAKAAVCPVLAMAGTAGRLLGWWGSVSSTKMG